MTAAPECPRCKIPLTSEEGDSAFLRCASCSGVMVSEGEVSQSLLQDAEPAVSPTDANQEEQSPICCPSCQQEMTSLQLGDATFKQCSTCRNVWLDGEKSGLLADSADAASALGRYLLYSVTLPERAVRSTVGLAAGAVRETAQFIVPQAFQTSKTYEIVVKNSLRFLTEDIGGVEDNSGEAGTSDDYMARKAVGNFVDLAGLATLHVSPLWFLAIVSDVAYGTKTYVHELAEELKKQGLIDEEATINHVDDVLQAVQTASGQAAGMFDTPPLSVDQLKASLDSTRRAITSADYRRVIPETELANYWKEMREIAQKEEVSLIGVSGALTMHTLGKVSTVSHGALTGIKVVGGLFSRHVVGHYIDSLSTLKEKGFYQTVQESSAPYIEAVWNNFASDKGTWTEEIVTGRVIGKAYKLFSGLLGGSKDDKKPDEPEDAMEIEF